VACEQQQHRKALRTNSLSSLYASLQIGSFSAAASERGGFSLAREAAPPIGKARRRWQIVNAHDTVFDLPTQ